MSNDPHFATASTYRYDTFTTALIIDDLSFRRTDPAAGDRVPAFDLETVDGGRFSSSALGGRPLIMVFGSLTCPVTESSGPVLRDLHAIYGDRVRFVMVNTREAHPGERIPQPRTTAEKLQHARLLRSHHAFAFEVAVDTIDGQLHRAMSPKPNSAYLLSPDGIILFRGHWANDRAALARALQQVVSGRPPKRSHSNAMVWPLMKAIGHLPGIVRTAGRKVARDVWRAVPPFGIMALMSRPFAFLPKDLRGVAGTATLAILAAGLAVLALGA
jgi:hypothetical protein